MTGLKDERYFWVILLLFAGVSSAISLIIGLRQSVWFDEAYSVLLASHSWGEVVRLTAADVHPPGYYLLLKGWISVFGSGELALRSLSVLFLGLSVGVSGLLARRMCGARIALLTLPFVAFAPFLLRYGFEIRMYSLASLIGITATYVLVEALKATAVRTRWLLFGLYALLVALGVYVLYFMALVWIAHLIWIVCLALKKRQPRLVFPAAGAYFAAILLFMPWLPTFLSTAGGGTLSPVTHPLGIDNLVGIVSFVFLYRPGWELSGVWGLPAALAVGATVYVAYYGLKIASPRQRRYIALCGLYVAVPVIILIGVTHIWPIYLERYLAHLIIGGYLGIGLLAALALLRGSMRSRIAAGVIAGVLLVGCVNLAIAGNYNFQRLHRPSLKLASQLLTDCRSGAVIFAGDPQIAIELSYYIKDCPVRFPNPSPVLVGGFAMLAYSPLRVSQPSEEFRGVKKLLYIYYDKPQYTLPAELRRVRMATVDALHIATYVHI